MLTMGTIAQQKNHRGFRPTWFPPVVSQGNLPWRNLPGELIVITHRIHGAGIFTYI